MGSLIAGTTRRKRGKQAMTSTGQHPRRCKATTKSGRACLCFALTGSDYCFSHDPALAEKRKEARSRGGHARHGRKLGSDLQAPVKINDLADVVRVVTEEINAVRSLEKSISRARAVGYLCGVLVGVYTQSEIESRIVALEQATGTGR